MTTPVEQAFDVGLLGDGSNTVFPYTFIALATTGFRVFTQNTTTELVMERSTPNDYTVTYNSNNTGGYILFIVPPAADETVNIFRDSPRDQLVTYIENSAFPAKNLENQLDKITRISQEISSTYFAALSPFDPSIFLVGPAGPEGVDGEPGVDGINGVDGSIGPQGIPGIDGTNGTDGINGADGAPGADGTNGTNGVDGLPGADGTDGTNGTDGAGVAAGGLLDQVLVKNSDADYDTKWETVAGATGEANTTSTAGTGASLTLAKVGADLPFRSITGGTNVQLEENAANIVINTDATVNATNAVLLNRANHTGTQLASTISDFQGQVTANPAVALNTTKETNATHTGEVTGSGVLAANATLITNKPLLPANAAQELLISSLSGILHRVSMGDVLNRANQTGTQLASTISDFDTSVASNAAVALNTTKQTNATHTGEVVGSGALVASATLVTNKATVGATSTNQILVAAGNVLRRMATSTVLARSAHTGTQLAATISNFAATVTNNAAVRANTAKVSGTARRITSFSGQVNADASNNWISMPMSVSTGFGVACGSVTSSNRMQATVTGTYQVSFACSARDDDDGGAGWRSESRILLNGGVLEPTLSAVMGPSVHSITSAQTGGSLIIRMNSGQYLQIQISASNFNSGQSIPSYGNLTLEFLG